MMDYNPFTLHGKSILVTGASSGIGRAIAVECSKMGAKVTITGRDINKLMATAANLHGEGHSLFPADLTNENEIEGLISHCPTLDGVAHCAGICSYLLCKDVNADSYSKQLDVNLKSPIMLQGALLKSKKINKASSIVFIASITSKTPYVGNSLYSASKGGIISYAKCLSLELASRQIRVNCISPAMVWTDLIYQNMLTKEDHEILQKKYPLKRYGTPSDIAFLAIYLLSDASAWMTGSNLEITGGVI